VIIDEMLRGTNSRDKQLGSFGYLRKLLKLPAYGLIATHDLALASLEEESQERIRNMRFEVAIEGDKLEFDYKLLPGVSQNLNAVFLMKKMGIME